MSQQIVAQALQNPTSIVYTPEIIDAAIKSLAKKHYGFGGNCAVFAVVLNKVLGGEGIYLLADSGDHYAFVDHVALKYQERMYDGSGLITRKQLAEWAESESGKRGIINESTDPSITGMVDSTGGGLGVALDADLLEHDLNVALAALSLEATAECSVACE